MKKLIFVLSLFLPLNAFAEDDITTDANKMAHELANKSANVKTTINLDSDVKDSELSEDALNFTNKLKECESFKATFKNTTREIIGKTDNRCEVIETTSDNKEQKCLFPMDKLDTVANYYRKVLSNNFSGKYNVDLKMKMPEVDFSNISSSLLDFSFKMEMPQIKVDKVKSEAENIIEEFCK